MSFVAGILLVVQRSGNLQRKRLEGADRPDVVTARQQDLRTHHHRDRAAGSVAGDDVRLPVAIQVSQEDRCWPFSH